MLDRRWPGLDGLRGCAVAAVVLYHLDLVQGGFQGVDVFFVLSGFLITRLVVAEYERTGRVALGRFYLRRSLRLYPALIVVSAFCVAVALAARRSLADTLHDAGVSVLYVANLFPLPSGLLDHTWTLALEEQFYLVWPPLLLLCLRGRSTWRWLPAGSLVIVVLALDLAAGRDGALHSYVRAMGLPLGCALALARPWAVTRLARFGAPAAVGLLLAVLLPLPAALTTGWPASIGAFLAVPVVALLTLRPVALFTWQPLRWLGLRSYGLYLWHFPLLALARHHAPEAIPLSARLVAGLLASLIAAELSVRLVERPALRLRDDWASGASRVERA